jgi:hypothetical protein
MPLAPAATSADAAELSSEQIRRYLTIYRTEAVHITRALYNDGNLRVLLSPYCPEIYSRPLNHMTRVQIVHHLGQTSYVLLGCLARENRLGWMSEDQYLACIASEGATFRRLRLQFRRFLPNEDGVSLRVWCEGVREIKSYLQLDVRFEFGGGACFGEAEAVLLPQAVLLGSIPVLPVHG